MLVNSAITESAVVLTGAGRAFCAGAELTHLGTSSRDGLLDIYEGFLRVGRSPKPTISAVNGAAVGAGMNLALITDLRINAPHVRASVVMPGHIGTHIFINSGLMNAFERARIASESVLDELHGTLSGPATKKLAERAYTVFGQRQYARLAGISVAHLYNLRHAQGYRRRRGTFPDVEEEGVDFEVDS